MYPTVTYFSFGDLRGLHLKQNRSNTHGQPSEAQLLQSNVYRNTVSLSLTQLLSGTNLSWIIMEQWH